MPLDTICTLPLPSELFAQVLHPSLPLLTVGLSSGHVHTYRLPSTDADASESDSSPPPSKILKANGINGTPPILSSRRRSSTASENGLGAIDLAWKTKRHKGSCRALALSHDGRVVYSAGTDGIVKAADIDTGRVTSKSAIPLDERGDVDGPTILHALSPMTLLLGADSGRLYVHDLRTGGKEMDKAKVMFTAHGSDFVSSITELPASATSTSGFSHVWVSTGGATVAVTDLRKGVMRQSEPQDLELSSSLFVGGLKKGGTSVGEKVLVGTGGGVVQLWERGVWDDMDERVVVGGKDVGVEAFCEVPPGSIPKGVKVGTNEKVVAVGLEDGKVRFLKVGSNRVVAELDVQHDGVEGVAALGFDVEGRMVTGGGQSVKVWTEAKGMPGGMRNEGTVNGKDDDVDTDEMSEDSSDEEVEKQKRKKRKRNKGKDKSGGRAINFSGLG